MKTEMIKERELLDAAAQGRIMAAEVFSRPEGFAVRFKIRGKRVLRELEAKRGHVRVYSDLDRLAGKLQRIGVTDFRVVMNS